MKLYLSSLDYSDFKDTLTIDSYEEFIITGRFVVSAKLSHPIIMQKYGFGSNDTDVIYLVNRFSMESINKIQTFPIHVYILIPATFPFNKPLKIEDLQNVAWGCLYDNYIDSILHKI